MKLKKLFAIALCLILTAGIFSACGEEPKQGTDQTTAKTTTATTAEEETGPYAGLTLYKAKSGVSFYMKDGYKEGELEGYACYYEGTDSALSFSTESFETLENAGIKSDVSLKEYAELVKSANNVESEVLTDEYGNVYIIYEKTIDGNDFTYYAFFGRGSKAYWTCNFFCLSSAKASFDKDFRLWASSLQLP